MTENHHCQDLLNSLSDYIDGDIDPKLCSEIEKHLSECENCRIVVNTTKKTIELYQNDSLTPAISEDIRSRLFLKLDLQDFLEAKNK
ncbi:MAG: zf-HC2 domain-containing protein [Anaerolineaceae bacterium]